MPSRLLKPTSSVQIPDYKHLMIGRQNLCFYFHIAPTLTREPAPVETKIEERPSKQERRRQRRF
jgi:hypothetical protein